jgi:murein DD-endopeptidase MepM/ murein hydrolase activator NlpD
MYMMNSLNSDAEKSGILPKSRFTEMLIQANALHRSGFDCWLFCRGMLFKSADKWWGDYGRREDPHEGIDLCLYRDRAGVTRSLGADTRIPVMQDGMVKAVIKDYLGHAVIIEHECPRSDTGKLTAFYAHTNPRPAITAGTAVKAGDIIATLAGTGNSKSKIRPHLHLSFGLPCGSFSYEEFAWSRFRDPAILVLLDPMAVLDRPYQTLDAADPACRF